MLLKNLQSFSGPVHAVNPNRSGDLLGCPVVPSVTEINPAPDLVCIAVPAPSVPEVIREAGTSGCRIAVIHADGFRESGEEGGQREKEIIRTAEETDMLVIGPNSAGFVLPRNNLAPTFVSDMNRMDPGNVAVVGQSGGITFTTAFLGMNRRRGFSAVLSPGNRSVTGFPELLTALDGDPETEAIGLYLEGVERAEELTETLTHLSTPVAVYSAHSQHLEAFARSHTGVRGENTRLDRDLLQREGIPFVDSCRELLDAAVLLACVRPPDRLRTAVVSAQAGPGMVISRRIQRRDLPLASFSEPTLDRLEELYPNRSYLRNPVDTGFPDARFPDAVEAVARDENVDLVIVWEIFEEGPGLPVEELSRVRARVEKPVLFGSRGPSGKWEEPLRRLERSGIPTATSPESLANLVRILDNARPAEPLAPSPPDPE